MAKATAALVEQGTRAERKWEEGRGGDYPDPVVPACLGSPSLTVQPELLGHQLPLGLKESLQPAVSPHVLHVPSSDEKGGDVHGAGEPRPGWGLCPSPHPPLGTKPTQKIFTSDPS